MQLATALLPTMAREVSVKADNPEVERNRSNHQREAILSPGSGRGSLHDADPEAGDTRDRERRYGGRQVEIVDVWIEDENKTRSTFLRSLKEELQAGPANEGAQNL